MTGSGPRWLLCRERRPRAPLRMYCLPHGGGSPGEYMRWSGALPGVEVWGVQFAGRGSRRAEEPPGGMPELVGALVSEVAFAAPYVLFGHSLGALVAYETALALRERGAPGPAALYLSGYRAPHLHEPEPGLAELPDLALAAAVERAHGPLPEEVKADPEVLAAALKAVRADLKIVAGYRPSPAEPLTCPLVVLGGEEDEESGEALTAWARYTTGPCTVRTFPGDHFYFRERTDDLLRYLATGLDELAAGVVPGPRTVGPAASLPRAGSGGPSRG
ncbi:thioesterase II family protein [Spongiactinospora sp. 9N601]|uniref:thioesterase II family protein n=1 Tax=Spongiactinospora sp. 9N601 TaxID=3375149 RepID=UPI0037B24835